MPIKDTPAPPEPPVRVRLVSTYAYRGREYGPGVVEVPASLAQLLALPAFVPVTAVAGIGPKTARELATRGIVDANQLARMPLRSLVKRLEMTETAVSAWQQAAQKAVATGAA